MPNIVYKYFYREIKEIVTAINKIDIAKKVIEAAKEQNAELLKQIVEQFKNEYSQLWNRMQEFYEDYWNENAIIFSNQTYKYNEEEFNCEDLLFLTIMSDEYLELTDLFLEDKIILDVIKNKGYTKIADYIEENSCLSTLEELLLVYKE